MRAALTLACARAVGGTDRQAAPAAAAVVHNLSLLYDDVLDGDTVRRHRAAAWQVFGPSSAARSADAMMLTAFDVLSEAVGPDGPVAREASAALMDVLIQLVVGGAMTRVYAGLSVTVGGRNASASRIDRGYGNISTVSGNWPSIPKN